MSELAYVDFFTVLRAILVGGFFLILPLITRKGLLFGVYVGEEAAVSEPARRLRRRWFLGCAVIALLAMVIGLAISHSGWILAGNYTCLGILITACPAFYFVQYRAARALAPPAAARQAAISVTTLEVAEPGGVVFARLALATCIAAGLATVIYAAVNYGTLPDRIPGYFGLATKPDHWIDKSVAGVMVLPALNLVLAPFFALMALLTTRAKRSFRAGTGGRSVEAQNAFRTAFTNVFSSIALFSCAILTFMPVMMIRIALGESRSMFTGFMILTVGMILYLFGYLVRLLVKYGQGGANLEEGSVEAPLTNGLADDTNWVWGIFYANRDDPSYLVEKRFGLGYAVNFGNWKAVVLFTTFAVVVISLATVGLVTATG